MLKIYNTLSREKEEFVPIHGNRVNMFVCGLSPYDYAHLGHAKTYVNYDVIARYLRFKGYRVFYLQNVTDVEDRIIKRANETGRETKDLVKEFFEEYLKNMEALNVTGVSFYAWATDYLPEIIEQIKVLIDKGYAYEANGSVYYDVNKFEDFGSLSNISVEDHTESLVHSAQLEEDESKRHPADFALWKAWKEGEPSWDSPWGKGRPGWHIEDTAIAITHFGHQYDIHGGATELMFPHHEAEIAQAEIFTGKKPYVKYWPHTGVLNVEGKKMSKSLGNFMTVQDALKTHDGQVIRFYIVNLHYRSQMDFTREELDDAKKGYGRLLETIRTIRNALMHSTKGDINAENLLHASIEQSRKKFLEAMDDDFNTREAIAILFEFSREVNRILGESRLSTPVLIQAIELFNMAGEILGLFQDILKEIRRIVPLSGAISGTSTVKGRLTVDKRVSKKTITKSISMDAILVKFPRYTNADYEKLIDRLMSLYIELREEARKRKDFEMSDWIRDELGKIGLVLEDTKAGIKWKKG
jgi:cysteinyl-tRNA synthetase